MPFCFNYKSQLNKFLLVIIHFGWDDNYVSRGNESRNYGMQIKIDYRGIKNLRWLRVNPCKINTVRTCILITAYLGKLNEPLRQKWNELKYTLEALFNHFTVLMPNKDNRNGRLFNLYFLTARWILILHCGII